MIIDTHHHYWKYNPVEYDWINDDMASIRRDFLPADLKETLDSAEVEGVITVQARQSLEETDWLLNMASENAFMRGVVGWVPLEDNNVLQILEKYSENKWLKGVRHVIQGEPDPEFILKNSFNAGISLLNTFDLVYDILIFEHQLPNTIRFVDRHPNQVFVLDHIAKPLIRDNKSEPWTKNIYELAKRRNVNCKISGMVTEADPKNWTEDQLQPYFDTVLEAFGPERLLFGSDWPVCLYATCYANWLQFVKKNMSKLSKDEQDSIFYKNAIRIYHLY